MNASTPRKIGSYEILEVLRRGPRPLYKARGQDGAMVALKTVPAEGVSADVRERFEREAAVCGTLDHPNIIRVLQSGEADGVLYLAMELLEGEDLATVIRERKALSWDEKLAIMEQVSAGLDFAHARDLVHRDIKPANLFLETSGRVRILDFGMARVKSSTLTQAGMAVGTLMYMAPEQIRGETCTASADLFAAGMVFFELATGRHPFAAGEREFARIAAAIVFQEPPPLAELAPDAPAGLSIVLGKALQKDVAQRMKSAADLKRALGLCRGWLASGNAPPLPEPASPTAQPLPAEAEKTRVIKMEPRSRPAAPPPSPPPPAPAPPPKPAVAVESAYCPKCTARNPKEAAFCSGCGSPLAAAPLPSLAALSEPETGFDWNKAVFYSLVLLLLVLILAWLLRQ